MVSLTAYLSQEVLLKLINSSVARFEISTTTHNITQAYLSLIWLFGIFG
jgi:hypothetical protein